MLNSGFLILFLNRNALIFDFAFPGRLDLRTTRNVGLILLFGLTTGCAPGADTIPWTNDLNQAIAAAKKENKPIMIDFMADWCPPCKEMDDSAFSDASVIFKAKSFIPVRIDIDKQPKVAAKYDALARAYGGVGIPNMLFMTSSGEKIKHIVGYQDSGGLLSVMDSVLKSSQRR
jgi:thioredoxin 1